MMKKAVVTGGAGFIGSYLIDYWRSAPVWTLESINEATKEWFRFLSKE